MRWCCAFGARIVPRKNISVGQLPGLHFDPGYATVSNAESAVGKVPSERSQKGSTEKVIVQVPTIVKEYNRFMDGVDLSDQLKAYYGIDLRCRYKYYLRVVFDSLDTAVVNGYLNFKALNPDTKMKTFGIQAKRCTWSRRDLHFKETYFSNWILEEKNNLIGSLKRKTEAAVIHDHHLPEIMQERKRFKVCGRAGTENRSRFKCVTCGIALCLQSDLNCFKQFHTG